MRRVLRIVVRLLLVATFLVLGLIAWAYRVATSDPIVRRVEVRLAKLPPGTEPLSIVLISDIHVEDPDMPPARLARLVTQVNALKPDLVLIAGDLLGTMHPHMRIYTLEETVAPLRGLKPRIGTFAVMGNHDYPPRVAGVRAALEPLGITLIDNSAAVAGPIAIAGLSDMFSLHDDLTATENAARATGKPIVVLTHSPDAFPRLAKDMPLMLAGHTHCGQIDAFGLNGATYVSRYGKRFACGIIRENGKALIVTAGLGTSGLPIRFGAPPDLWLITLTPQS